MKGVFKFENKMFKYANLKCGCVTKFVRFFFKN